MWNLIVSVPEHCLSFYFPIQDEFKGKWSQQTEYANKGTYLCLCIK